MTGFDIAVLLIVGACGIFGFVRGFVQEILALSAWVISVLAIRYLHTDFSLMLEPLVGSESGGSVLAFALLLLVPYGLVRLISRYAGVISRNSVLGPIDRALGLGFGVVKATLLIIAAFSMIVLAYDTIWGVGGRPEWITKSRTYSFINAGSEAMVTMIADRRREAAEAASEPSA